MGIKLSAAQIALVRQLAHGHHLKGHRDLEGQKLFRLYNTTNNEVIGAPAQADIEFLREQGLLVSNMKFPAARFFLSPAGHQLAQNLGAAPSHEK